jgi:cold shock CspA family protein
MTGTLKTTIVTLGFGFITGEDGLDYLFNRRNLASDVRFESLMSGERVSFVAAVSSKNPNAVGVSRSMGPH